MYLQQNFAQEYKVLSRVRNIHSCSESFCNQKNDVLLQFTFHIQIAKFRQGCLDVNANTIIQCGRINCIYLSKSSKWLAIGHSDSKITIWNIDSLKEWQMVQTLDEHINYIKSIRVNNDETLMISQSGGEFHNLILWKVNSEQKWEFYMNVKNNTFQVRFVSFSKSCDSFAFTHGFYIRIWKEVNDWKEYQIIENKDRIYYQKLCYISDDKLVVTTENGELLTYEDFTLTNRMKFSNNSEVQSFGLQIRYIEKYNFLIFKHAEQMFVIDIQKYQIIQIIDNFYGSINVTQEGYLLLNHQDKIEVRCLMNIQI